jgi:hypothetical protein
MTRSRNQSKWVWVATTNEYSKEKKEEWNHGNRECKKRSVSRCERRRISCAQTIETRNILVQNSEEVVAHDIE